MSDCDLGWQEADKVTREPIDTAAWRETVYRARDILENTLNITNPLMVELLEIWQHYARFSLVCNDDGMMAARPPAALDRPLHPISRHAHRGFATLFAVVFVCVCVRGEGGGILYRTFENYAR